MRIKDISCENRPRERLIRDGVKVLSDAELLAVVIKYGCRGSNVVDISNRLISKFGLSALGNLSMKELTSVKGIGRAKGCQILALFELSKRSNVNRLYGKEITCAEDVKDYVKSRLRYSDREQFMVLMLDSKNRVIKDEIVSVGILNSALVHPREVFKGAIKASANAVILVHNHPSGDVSESSEDTSVAARLKECGEVLGVKVLDSVVV